MCSTSVRNLKERMADEMQEIFDEDVSVCHVHLYGTENGQEDELGSRLEKELNRSIEKMREEECENEKSPDYIDTKIHRSPQAILTSPPNVNSPEEMLEDIDMPSCSTISILETTDLVNISLVSSPSPLKKETRKNSSSVPGNARNIKIMTSTMESPIKNFAVEEIDLCTRMNILTESPVQSTSLLNIEVESANLIESPKNETDKIPLTSSSPLAQDSFSPVNPRMTLGAGVSLLDIDTLNDSLMLTSSKDCQLSQISPSLCRDTGDNNTDLESTKNGKGDSLLMSRVLSEAKMIAADLEFAATSSDSDHTTTTDSGITQASIDMGAMNDNLLSSIVSNSPENKLQKESDSDNATVNPDVLDNKIVEGNITFENQQIFTDAILKKEEDPFSLISAYTKDCDILLSTYSKDCEIQIPQENNRTFDQQSKRQNTTFDKCSANQIPSNDTFNMPPDDCHNDDTFSKNMSNVYTNRTFGRKNENLINTTLERKICEDDSSHDVIKSPVVENALNVTFEKGGEIKIGALNETVNLMDAEGEVLQIILDATPKKAVKRKSLNDTFTPKGIKPMMSSTLTKDPSTSFLRRLSLGGKWECSGQETSTSASQSINPLPPVPGLKHGGVVQSFGKQLRRMQSGAPKMKLGPLKALPLQSMGPLSSSNTQSSSDLPVWPVECERPGTPDAAIITGAGMSTPDLCKRGSPMIGPRITSTPTMNGAGPFCVGMDGPVPTPISRCRIVSIGSTVSSSSLPGGRSDGTSQESEVDGEPVCNPLEQPAVMITDLDILSIPHIPYQQEPVTETTTQTDNSFKPNSTIELKTGGLMPLDENVGCTENHGIVKDKSLNENIGSSEINITTDENPKTENTGFTQSSRIVENNLKNEGVSQTINTVEDKPSNEKSGCIQALNTTENKLTKDKIAPTHALKTVEEKIFVETVKGICNEPNHRSSILCEKKCLKDTKLSVKICSPTSHLKNETISLNCEEDNTKKPDQQPLVPQDRDCQGTSDIKKTPDAAIGKTKKQKNTDTGTVRKQFQNTRYEKKNMIKGNAKEKVDIPKKGDKLIKEGQNKSFSASDKENKRRLSATSRNMQMNKNTSGLLKRESRSFHEKDKENRRQSGLSNIAKERSNTSGPLRKRLSSPQQLPKSAESDKATRNSSKLSVPCNSKGIPKVSKIHPKSTANPLRAPEPTLTDTGNMPKIKSSIPAVKFNKLKKPVLTEAGQLDVTGTHSSSNIPSKTNSGSRLKRPTVVTKLPGEQVTGNVSGKSIRAPELKTAMPRPALPSSLKKSGLRPPKPLS